MLTRNGLPAPDYIDLDGERIATYVLEPLDREPVGDVVLCHGTPWSSAVWATVARQLAADRRVFMYDMPGYGASISAQSVNVDLVSQRRRVAALLKHWGLVRPDVVAHDIGGAVALGAHLFEEAQMSSLYLLDVVILDPWGSPFFRLVAQHQEVFAALPQNLHAALVREYISGASNGTLSDRQVAALAAPWCTPEGQRAFYRQIAELKPEHTRPIAENLGKVSCPVRVAWGELDPWIPVTQAADLAEKLPGDIEVFATPNAGHLVQLEASDSLAADIAHWLNKPTA
ncbi:MAG: alpha/beta fold hydrolase [Leucobacter sp.]